MNLYKAHGVSPFGGCLPSLIQMPIWIALFSTLNYAVELYHSSFFWYITDLSAKDPYYLAPLLMGSVMFLQMRMSPAGTDPQQQKMMSVMMPVMFTGFSLFLPAGLSIYTLTSYLIGILQQLYVNRTLPRTTSRNDLPSPRPSLREAARSPCVETGMRIRQHVNPLRSDYLQIPLEPLALPPAGPSRSSWARRRRSS
jgi:membrane protein insertase Oxa1/YidC/SpoIIIJ